MKTKLLFLLIILALAISYVIFLASKSNLSKTKTESNLENTLKKKTETKQIIKPTEYGYYDWPNKKKGCEIENLNKEGANQWMEYRNEKMGIKMGIPYNENWGCPSIGVRPYEETKKGLEFGQIVQGHPKGCVRYYSLSFLSPSTINELVNVTQNNPSIDRYVVKEINGIRMFFYEGGEFCRNATLEIPGKKTNYHISTYCGSGFEDLEEIAKTIELIE